MMRPAPAQIPEAYEPLLARVEKPGRYVGGEMNAVAKDPASLRASIALAFPDVYDVGMSYHGFRLLYERVNARAEFAAERVFTPWPDFADALRAAGLPLTTLETYRPLAELEIVGFTLQHELSFTNVLEMLDLAGIPVRAADRTAPFPLVIAGGEGAYSPEPMAEFIDAFVLGDGEEVVLDLLECAAEAREAGVGRAELLETLAGLTGVYVPSLYDVAYAPDDTVRSVTPKVPAAPAEVEPRVFDISLEPGSVRPVVPLIRTIQNRTVVEVRRGCVQGCRFCQAGMITRPVRERPVAQVREIVRESLRNSGDDSVSLLSLSTADYTEIGPLVRGLNAELAPRRVSISLPSLRINAFDVGLAAEVSSVRKSGFTFAPEAGSERLRRVINKPLDEAEFAEVIRAVLRAGWKTLKLYFMIGLPSETDEDLDGIARIIETTLGCAREVGVRGARLNVTLSPFAPKAHTPFQWCGQPTLDELRRRIVYVRGAVRNKAVSFKTPKLEASVLEAVLARGDRRLGAVIEHAWRGGCRFDAWSERFRPDLWKAAFAESDLDPAWYAGRERGDDEVFPWDHLLSGPGKRYLAAQRDLARDGEVTPDCVKHDCSGCAACGVPKEHVLARDAGNEAESDASDGAEAASPDPTPAPRQPPLTDPRSRAGESDPADPTRAARPMHGARRRPLTRGDEAQGYANHPQRQGSSKTPTPQPPQPVMRVRLRFSKSGPLRFVAHLDVAELVHRLMRRCEAPLAYSHGFNPQPRTMPAPPLALGFEGRGEPVDALLLERVRLEDFLRNLRAATTVAGLEWTAAEEVALKVPSIQQTIERYAYELRWRRWGDEAPVLPVERDALEDAIADFMLRETWPIDIIRKGKPQKRDARTFVEACKVLTPSSGYDAALTMTVRSENGTTLSPLRILEAIFDGPPEQGLILRAAREVVEL